MRPCHRQCLLFEHFAYFEIGLHVGLVEGADPPPAARDVNDQAAAGKLQECLTNRGAPHAELLRGRFLAQVVPVPLQALANDLGRQFGFEIEWSPGWARLRRTSARSRNRLAPILPIHIETAVVVPYQ